MMSCAECGLPLAGRDQLKFCSRSCSVRHNNRKQPKRKRPRRQCRLCQNFAAAGRKKCSTCIAQFLAARWNLDLVESDRLRRRILIRECGHRCAICLLDRWMNHPIPLELDHVDGNSDNNSRENLRLVCPNCHAQTGTYKGRNIGHAGTRGQKRTRKLRQLQASVLGAAPRPAV